MHEQDALAPSAGETPETSAAGAADAAAKRRVFGQRVFLSPHGLDACVERGRRLLTRRRSPLARRYGVNVRLGPTRHGCRMVLGYGRRGWMLGTVVLHVGVRFAPAGDGTRITTSAHDSWMGQAVAVPGVMLAALLALLAAANAVGSVGSGIFVVPVIVVALTVPVVVPMFARRLRRATMAELLADDPIGELIREVFDTEERPVTDGPSAGRVSREAFLRTLVQPR